MLPKFVERATLPLEVGVKAVKDSSQRAVVKTNLIGSIFNLTKCLIGTGVLSLSQSMVGTGVGGAIMLCVCFALFNICGFSAVGRTCSDAGVATFYDLGVAAHSRKLANFMSFVVVLTCGINVSGFIIVVSTSFVALSSRVGLDCGGYVSYIMWAFATCVALPLCLLRDLSALKQFSVVGTFAVGYVFLMMTYRYADGSYAEGGQFYNKETTISIEPTSTFTFGINGFLLAAILNKSYCGQFIAPMYWTQLKNATVRRFDAVVVVSYTVCASASAGFMVAGYATFGDASQGNILDNYSIADTPALVAQCAMMISIIFSLPLMFGGMRDCVMELFGIPDCHRTVVIVWCLALLTSFATAAGDLATVQQWHGAVLGPLVGLIAPPFLYLRLRKTKNLSLTVASCVTSAVGVGALVGGVAMLHQ